MNETFVPGIGAVFSADIAVPDHEREEWSVHELQMEDGGARYADYNMLGEDGNPAAGICHARGVNVGLPPVWMIYLPVGNLAESLRRVEEEGGKVIKTIKGEDGEYINAAVQDPVGAHLALMPG